MTRSGARSPPRKQHIRSRASNATFEFVSGASPKQEKLWGLRGLNEHALTLGASHNDAAAAQGSAAKFAEVCEALSALSVRPEEIEDLLGLVSAILHLRDVRFVPLADEEDGGCRPVAAPNPYSRPGPG